jgi:hypothetical protein
MKTEQLVDMLARQAGPAPRKVVETRLALAAGVGALASAGLAIGALGLNTGLMNMGAALAVKLAYVVGVLLAAAWFADRVSRPGAPWQRAAAGVAGAVLAMSVLAAVVWIMAPDTDRVDLLLGRSWASCPWRVTALSAPALVALLWALRGLAPTRPRLAGFAAGLLAGSLGALGYALHCPELSPVFVLVWYSLGILVPAAGGALMGPWLLRW